jgi:hypothetical protein
MPYQPYTTILNGPTTFTVALNMKMVYLTVTGRSATATNILANNPIIGAPAPSAITILNNEVRNFIGPFGGYLERIEIDVPAGGSVEIAVQRD